MKGFSKATTQAPCLSQQHPVAFPCSPECNGIDTQSLCSCTPNHSSNNTDTSALGSKTHFPLWLSCMLLSTGSRRQLFGLRDLTLNSFSQGLPCSSTKTYSYLPSDFHSFLPIIPQYPRKGHGSSPGRRRALRSSISIQPGAPTWPNTVLGRAAPGPKPSLA